MSDGDSYTLGEEMLKELASPKYSHLPFYLKPTADTRMWSYDNTDIRGRKFYWHSDKFGPAGEKTKRNVTMQLLKPARDKELKFGFDIFFDGVTKAQLDELIWSLTLGENKSDSSLCYKIGHGKPLGLGSTKITVDKKIVRSFAAEYALSEEAVAEKPVLPENMGGERSRKQVLKIMDMTSTAGQNVVYPYVAENEVVNIPENNKTALASLKWFSTNFKMGSKSRPCRYLPDIMDGDLCLDACGVYNANDSDNQKSGKPDRNTRKNNKEYDKYSNKEGLSQKLFIPTLDENEEKTDDAVYDAVVGKIDKFVNITLSDGTRGTLEKKTFGLKKGDKIKVKFSRTISNNQKIYKLVKN